ncbi:MAG: 16S rRNA (cytosine(1402)-N(4))-methyltransferase RsmH [Endomicrobium sp.]|jgi:16S rRNA (cytosine1402-N4)-methyltransferase|nr:16S rRNA (cytosine(1402)-N(4))-methyltransferase RsmH [Endomicrobium sp.]
MLQSFNTPNRRDRAAYHLPVMPLEVCKYLITDENGLYVDCTFGGGGHSSLLLQKFPNIKIIAFDWDADSQNEFKERENIFNGRLTFVRDNFKNIKSALSNIGVGSVSGILADVGVSSKQFDDETRGFSFNSSVLDMRMDLRNALTAKEVVNSYGQEELADIFYKYGEEYRSKQIASAIVERRKRGIITSARELHDIIRNVKKSEGKINPATKVFQALRIFVNSELENLETLLSCAPSALNKGARIVIVSFHSLEDRIVKNNFKQNALNGVYNIVAKKVIAAGYEEIKQNPRARSAKIRAAEKIYE